MAVYRDLSGSVVLLVDADNRIAMQLREDIPNLPAANQWGLFGGLIDAGETPKQTALREIYEELTVHLNPDRLHFYRKHYISAQNLTTWIFEYHLTNELNNTVLNEGQTWDYISQTDPRVANIGLHHHEIVLGYWAKQDS